MNTQRTPTHLFLDDERFPVEDGNHWAIVRTVPQAVAWIKANGMPKHIAFDNDLQAVLEGRHLASWLIRVDMEQGGKFIPEDFTFFAHSQNSVNGITALLNHHLDRRLALIQRLARAPKF